RAGRILGAKPFPLAARKLAELTRDPDVPLADLVAVLESDSALSARLLRLVNSAGYALRVRCTSVRHAAALVGIEKLHQVSTTAAILDLFDSQTTHAARILEHGTIVAALSRYLAAHLSLPTDELFTAGFLHDIGKLMLLETEGERYVELLEQNADRFDSLHRAERERFGFDHAVLGAHVLAAWNIPQPIPRLVAWHHQLGRAYEAGTRWCSMICTLRLADQLSYCLDADDPGETISRVAAGEAAKFLDISEAQLDAMWHELRVLMLRSRAVFRGEEPPVLEPLPAHRLGRLKKSVEEAPPTQEPRVPKSFPCVVCEEPSFGNRCQACGGHVCPDHELAPDSWCTLCVQDWHEHLEQSQLSLPKRLLITSVGIVLAALAGYGASRGEVTSGVSVAVGSTLALALAWTVALVGGRWWRRTGFLRHRPNREQHEARRVAPEEEPAIAADSPELQAAIDAGLPDLGTEGPNSGPPDSDLDDPAEAT
ncbi:MAG: HDOD domain-containing protein, partial [Myxococcales bacterium]|nr:HDOD domain-containing protein [Myxococcales bacterium]